MAKKKIIQPSLPVSPISEEFQKPPGGPSAGAGGPPVLPIVLREYAVNGTAWRVGRFDLLLTEFAGLGRGDDGALASDLPAFHLAMEIQTRGWMILRRLFGICLMIPAADSSPDDLRTWTREELMASLAIEPAQLREELDRLRGIWKGAQNGERRMQNGDKAPAKLELDFASESLVERHGMKDLLTRDEIPWMASRLSACAMVINHPQVGEMMRMALLTELDARRVSREMARISKEMAQTEDQSRKAALRTEYDWSFKKSTSLQSIYREQIDQVDKVFPFMKQTGGMITMRSAFSDAVACHTEWYKDGTNKPADGVFTVGEIDVLMRMSVQSPEPQYRLGQIMWLNSCRAFLFDPNFRGQFPARTLKKVDAAYKAAAMEVSTVEGEALTDLMSDDPVAGEYPAGKV